MVLSLRHRSTFSSAFVGDHVLRPYVNGLNSGEDAAICYIRQPFDKQSLAEDCVHFLAQVDVNILQIDTVYS